MTTQTIAQLSAEIRDFSERLYYCSNTGEGRKMRKEIEKAIRQKEFQLQQIFIQEGCLDYQFQAGQAIQKS